ncbi:hypothetical protein BV98_001284 [Sphingobium herbicidovorans NBRC 16415]|uniref:Uncharacterized protein n=1 Tax=Sphingobium herbicidovorans (strain ATCC 700291 / DSM 11019 / CCUG 56400 / KCTC 2939 / LMG 18315 / NBRC 16415 / MH) TaxID=1219045 RepID=A0A086PBZ9_SPHHM|nr:DUF3237 domain-containing protein [Sphingobium herbicidovorans]KFG90917.1 hypothetical protein BV98_001284 [Sphingobium herbicidovorans NBRC 16415]
MKLTPLCTMTAYVDNVTTTGRMAIGNRQLYVVRDGVVEGERIKGKVQAGGGDNLLVDPSGMGHVDARVVWETDDGVIIYVQYFGRVMMNEKVGAAFKAGAGTEFGDCHFVTQPRFECGDPRYAWLNETVAIAEGRVAEGRAIQYKMYACDVGE